MKNFGFYVITDMHYIEDSLGVSGAAYDDYMKTEQYCLKENQPVTRDVLSKIAADDSVGTLIISGDLSKNGEYESHVSLTEDLRRFAASGKKVFVITARHDFNDTPCAYKGNERIPVKGTKREELYGLYREFGFGAATHFDRESLSYIADIGDDVCLLAMNSDGTDECKGNFDERLYSLFKEWIDEAHARGKTVISTNHYPILPLAPVFGLVGDAQMKDYRRVASFLADNGVKYNFTGHMHAQSVKKFTSESGNVMYDIQTTALAGYPARYRKCVLSDEGLHIESIDVTTYSCEYFAAKFDEAIPNKLKNMLKAGGPDAKKSAVFLNNRINSVTLGGILRLAGLRASRENAKTPFIEIAKKLVIGIFAGEQDYAPGTALYCDFEKLLKRLSPVLKKLDAKFSKPGYPVDLRDMLLKSLYNAQGIDNNNCDI